MRTKKVKLSDDREVEVRELPIGKFNHLLNVIKGLGDGLDLSGAEHATEEAIGAKVMASLPGILAKGWGDFMDVIVDSTNLTKEDLEEKISLTDGLTIIQAMIEVNDMPSVIKTIGQWFGKTTPANPLQTGSPT